jgi:hypothetical protein
MLLVNTTAANRGRAQAQRLLAVTTTWRGLVSQPRTGPPPRKIA